jgi:hypothetical protein
MSDFFQRLITMSDSQPLSVRSMAALGPVRQPDRSQFSLLVRHFLERFFNHETASPEGDAKARLVLIAVATGIPGFVVALYLWPIYHPFIVWPPGHALNAGPPPYWQQVNHHFFFVVYSFVAMGIVTVFQWDLFFPDLLDVFVLSTLPIQDLRLFIARVAAIAVLIGGFLFDANFLALLILPASLDPPNLPRFLSGHALAVAGSGLFAAAFVLVLQGVLLSLLGERWFRRISLLLQGLSISVLLMFLLLFPVLSRAAPLLLQTGSVYAFFFPPFWFLGVYQWLMEGPSALPIYARLAQTGCIALLVTTLVAMLAYPLAYLRRVRQLVVGPGTHDTRIWVAQPFLLMIFATLVRHPVRRAVFHFISQSLFRVQRYRIYLVLYGGVGLSVVVASILRLTVKDGHVRMGISHDGVLAAIGIAAFWMIVGLRMAFVSPGNQHGSWVFRIVHGRPPHFLPAMHQLQAAKVWALICGLIVTIAACLALRAFAPRELRTWLATSSQLLIAVGLCLLLTDILFLHVRTVAFTGETAREQPNLPMTLLKCFTFFPVLVLIPVVSEPWIEANVLHFALAAAVIAISHLVLRTLHRQIIQEHCNIPGLEDDEEEFPMRLGLRY